MTTTDVVDGVPTRPAETTATARLWREPYHLVHLREGHDRCYECDARLGVGQGAARWTVSVQCLLWEERFLCRACDANVLRQWPVLPVSAYPSRP